MAQATGAQREPSMEEILASIRRIIEDSDGKKDTADPAVAETATGAPLTAANTEVDAFRAELRGSNELHPVAKPAAAPRIEPVFEKKPISLAEIQAEIRSSLSSSPGIPSADLLAARSPAPELERPEFEAVVSPARQDDPVQPLPFVARYAGPTIVAPVEQDDVEPSYSLSSDAVEAQSPLPIEAGGEEDDVTVDDAASPGLIDSILPASAKIAPPAAAPGPSKTAAIISAAAGRQVAAAFGELSGAFAASRQKSFDEMAEQMMRPMLQEWFDNNLPTLVERIVREEIERVARGG